MHIARKVGDLCLQQRDAKTGKLLWDANSPIMPGDSLWEACTDIQLTQKELEQAYQEYKAILERKAAEKALADHFAIDPDKDNSEQPRALQYFADSIGCSFSEAICEGSEYFLLDELVQKYKEYATPDAVAWNVAIAELSRRKAITDRSADLRFGQWVKTDIAQYVRLVDASQSIYEVTGIVQMPEDFAVCHGQVYPYDYDDEDRNSILGPYGYESWDALVESCNGDEVVAGQIFAEAAFETEFAVFVQKHCKTEAEALQMVKNIVFARRTEHE